MKIKHVFLLTIFFVLSCSKSNNDSIPIQAQTSKNYLTMKINGVTWVADREIFGAFHPKGYDKAIMISGAKGPKDKNEQLFNINLYKKDGVGTYTIIDGNADNNVAQLLNLTPENFQAGSITGFNMTVNITKASGTPDEVEATFEGTLNGIDGSTVTITEGKFYFHE